jgi:hypothetical protein
MPNVIRYGLDTTGLNSDNFVSGETHVLANFPLRTVVPTYGAFYTESVKVYDANANRLLTRGTHYICTELAVTPSELYGKEICYLVLITDATVSANVRLDYQALGGLYGASTEAILSVYNAFLNSSSNAAWNNILNKPAEFNPSAHLHDIGDVYGFEYVVNALERIKEAITISATPAFQRVLGYIDDQISSMQNTVTIASNALSDHSTDASNPHQTNKAQIGLANVSNLRTASTTDINKVIANVAAITDDAYVTVAGLLFFNKNNTSASTDSLAAAKAYADSKDSQQLGVVYQSIIDNVAAVNNAWRAGDNTTIVSARNYTDGLVASTKTDTVNLIHAKGIRYPNHNGIALPAATNVILSANMGKWHEVQLDGSVTTLPALASVDIGATVTITCCITKAAIQTFSTTELISIAGSTYRTSGIRLGETITFTSNGQWWYITSIGSPSFMLTPVNSIVMFDGDVGLLPSNWAVCDGTRGTPNLRDKFVVGAGGRWPLGTTGGTANAVSVNHNHAATSTFIGNALGGHSHGVNDPTHHHNVQDNGHAHGVNDPGHSHVIEAPVRINDQDRGGGGSLFSLDSSQNTATNHVGTGISIQGSLANISIAGNPTGVSIQASAAGTPTGTVSTSIAQDGVSGIDQNLPPYYALVYIKRLY